MTTPKIDPELRAKLKALGIDPESDQPQWVNLPPVQADSLPSVQKHREMMAKLKELLQQQLDKDVAELEALRTEQERLKNGGGT